MTPLRILLIGNYEPDRQFSMLAYARMLHEGLRAKGHDAHLIAPKAILGRLPFLEKWFGYIDKFILFLPRLIMAARKADVAHVCDHSNAMYVRWIEKRPHLITCHDLLAVRSAWGHFPQNPVRATGRFFQRLIVSGLTRATRVVADSPATAEELTRFCSIAPERITQIDISLNYPYAPMPAKEADRRLAALGLPAPGLNYILHVGTRCWYKDHEALLAIFAHLHRDDPALRLVTVGAQFDAGLRALAKRLGIASALLPQPAIENEDLRALYSLAQALIFPSIQEGFGWPVIEAQACGCPVFASDRPPLPHVGGEAAVYFDPDKPEDAARHIREHWGRRREMAAEGLVNVRRFAPETMIDRIIEEYGRACGKSGGA